MLAALSATAAASDPNRLAGEASPYLRRHAHDPVDWHPWGTEAFDRAAEQQKPVFLSIGFSTCHWCHVMERESFQDPDTAAFLNQHFICIKVDRDERPDVDQVYMTFVQATTGKGGWPLSVWLTPDRQPFAGGTYFAAEDRPGRPGFRTVLAQVARAWDTDRESLLASSKNTTAALRTLTSPPEPTATALDDRDIWNRAFIAVEAEFDRQHGGFGGPAKFPRPSTLDFLCATRLLDSDEDHRRQAETMAQETLRAMAAGAIRDQLGGGFHRYTVDAAWQEPHFELLLADQAQVALAYLTAFQVTGDDSFATIARGLLDAVLRDMAAPGGGFHAAIDADSLPTAGASEPIEGGFYRWTRSEIDQLLGGEQARLFCHRYGPEAVGPAAGVLFERHTLAETAEVLGLTEADAAARLADARSLLLAARGRRPRPAVDATLIASANGLMISALARGHQLLGDPAYREAADAAADRILRDLVDHDGSLGHARHGAALSGPGFADDYALLIQGLLDLSEASFDSRRLEQALALQQRQDAVFLDAAAGGYFASPADDSLLIVRPKPDRDEAVPSANAVSLANLRRLATIRDDPALRERAERLVAALRGRLEQTPAAALRLLVESRRLTTPATHVVIAGRRDAADTAALAEAVWRCPATNCVLLLADGDERLAQLSPLLRLIPEAGATAADPGSERPATAYVCTGETCHPPTTDPAEVRRLLTAAITGEPVRGHGRRERSTIKTAVEATWQ